MKRKVRLGLALIIIGFILREISSAETWQAWVDEAFQQGKAFGPNYDGPMNISHAYPVPEYVVAMGLVGLLLIVIGIIIAFRGTRSVDA